MRQADLATVAFEEATVDKNEQREKTTRMSRMLETAVKLHKVMSCITVITDTCGVNSHQNDIV